ncbi:MAG: hypothetical protein E6G79_18560 [Alphaproteobacteria bacterium]|jgi:hypothetical protein|nr:MAG: hypothetical protein E6G79_18560 [Alphaproteobacteria bacterium]
MSSDSKARPSESVDFSDAVRQAREARGGKEASPRAAQPAATGTNASAVATDEARAKEALEGLKRIRTKARLDKMAIPKPAPVDVRPAVIVAKPPASRPPWVAPLAGLAIAVALVISACTGVIAYMTAQPSKTNGTTSADIRNLRDTVVQLRRQVSGVSESLDGLRTSVDLSSKATTDRFGRFADNLDRIERASSSSTAKLDRLAQAAVSAPPQPPAQSMPMTSGGSGIDTTGSLLPSERASAPKKVVKGWSVRQAYEGIAILQGPNGLVEAILGQQVPGLGHIEEIRNENGRLLVLSSSGAILPARKGLP